MESISKKWAILAVVILGSFMPILDNNIVNVALPKIMATFGATVDQIEWVVTGYMIAFAIIMPATNWLQEFFGLKKVFIGSLTLFCLGSAFCGLAWSKDSLILFRILQALGGGALMPCGLTLVSLAFLPKERGMAMGIWSIGAMVAPAVGPFLGGYLADEMSWRAIFYINLPIGAITILAAVFILPAIKNPRAGPNFDFLGFSGLAVFLAFLLIALAQGQREGWNSDYILSCFGLSILGLVVFIMANFFVQTPIVDLRLFAIPNFLMANIINFVRAVAIFGSLFLLPLFLQNLLQYSAFSSGVVLAPLAITVAIVAPFSGLISDRIGPRLPLTLGTILVAISLYLFKDLSLNSDYWFLFWPQVLRGVGLGLINAPLMSAAINAVPRENTGVAASFLTIIMQIGGAFGVSLLSTVLQRREFFHYAHFVQHLSNPLSPIFRDAQEAAQSLLLKLGYAPSEVFIKGQALLALWFQRQATVWAFQDAFVFSALLICIGIGPALLIRNQQVGGRQEKPILAGD